MRLRIYLIFIWVGLVYTVKSQNITVFGKVSDQESALGFALIAVPKLGLSTLSDASGNYQLAIPDLGQIQLEFSYLGYFTVKKMVDIQKIGAIKLNVTLQPNPQLLNEVTISGTLKEISKKNSPVSVEIFTPRFFAKNPTSNMFEALQMVNGVQPTINCNVCNTGDIHINGMEGPYTMVLIDGMPIVSALSTVYGLSGIPNSMIERIEIVKGPSSTLYGSEAVAGLINVITKNAYKAPKLSIDVFGTSYKEYNVDIGTSFQFKKASTLLSVNYFNFNNKVDNNKDNFTDLALQNRISIFNKWNFKLAKKKMASIGIRYFNESRYGGEMQFNQSMRGSNSIYGESIYTKRVELIGLYPIPLVRDLKLMYSYNYHNQNSYYGMSSFLAKQQIGFGQLVWEKKLGNNHDVLLGAAMRYTFYDDNTPATENNGINGISNNPSKTWLPGLFLQDEISLTSDQQLLVGVRYDYYAQHGNIFSPRMNYKFSINPLNTLRVGVGNGFRVVNLFTEDHQALTGARTVVVKEDLNPEKSWNGNVNYTRLFLLDKGVLNLDASAFYTYFTNRIIADYDTDPNLILYKNLNGNAVSRGVSMNADFQFKFPLKITTGFTLMQVYKQELDSLRVKHKQQQIHAPGFSGTWQCSYTISSIQLAIDYTGQVYGPMRLPVLPNDFRPEYSPWFAIHNIQLTQTLSKRMSIYGGVKNMFNFIPQNPIMRPFDPFDKTANDSQTNPNGYTFDPSYNYASLQGVRFFVGFKYLFL